MTWIRRSVYVLPVLVAALTISVMLVLDGLGAYCAGKDSGLRDPCNGLGDAQWIVLAAGALLTALSIVVWLVAMLTLLARRFRSHRNHQLTET